MSEAAQASHERFDYLDRAGASRRRFDRMLIATVLTPVLAGMLLSVWAGWWIGTGEDGVSQETDMLRGVLISLVVQGLVFVPYGGIRLWQLGRNHRAYRRASIAAFVAGAVALCCAARWARGV